ncbi:hypothetical protein Pmani_002855 [Petrolisthes manimaculis]|uniref:Cytochrome P450 n=1 Tax=Petrolisthes manimaculis TaxID=1843537 RepID=A0AAE1UQ15_9EUCA|nr:hypothetical protein Pmani_002855 [Petrolisthes manimaculis]
MQVTATTLGFCLHYLALHPHTQDLLYQELTHVDPYTHSLQGLSYLRAVVQETLRLRPSASARSRFIQEDVVFSGYHVPAGTFVLSPPVVACHDPNTFPDPHAFRPQRWLTRPTNNHNNNKINNNINNTNKINHTNNNTTNKINNNNNSTTPANPTSPTPTSTIPPTPATHTSPTTTPSTPPTPATPTSPTTTPTTTSSTSPTPPTPATHTSPTTTPTPTSSTTPSTPPTPTTRDGVRVHPYTIVAFGHGARMCPGRRLAEQEIYLAIIQLVQTYKMEVSGDKKTVGQIMRLNMMPDAAFSIIFTPRN